MAQRIPAELIDEIRAANDIVEVISERVAVKKAGRNFKGLCPFHSEKTPSFNINPQRQIYHCFGCGAGGNVISFLMEFEKIGFIEAIKELAARAGIALPERAGSDWREEKYDPVYKANAFAWRHFRECYLSDAGRPAREYCAQRGLGEEVTETFKIGHATQGWDGLLKAAMREGVPEAALENAGLAIRRESGAGLYDRFRERLMFPLSVSGGRVAGFGGRALGEQEPKYLNTPETCVYHKGRYLYGLAEARLSIRTSREAILVEGYMDLLSLYQAGFHNAVASSGTALTDDQARLLGRFVDKVFVAYDGDAAGIAAAIRAAKTFVRSGVKVRVADFPGEQDPDSYLNTQGAAAVKERLEEARDFIDFFVHVKAPKTPDEREQAVKELLASVTAIDDPVKADLMLEKISDVLSIGRGALTRAYEAGRADVVERGGRRAAGAAARPTGAGVETAAARAEKGLLALLLSGGPTAGRIRQAIVADDFADPALRALATELLGVLPDDEPIDVAALAGRVDDVEARRLLTEISFDCDTAENGDRLRCDYVRTIRRCQIQVAIRALESAIESAEMTDDEEALFSLIARRQELAGRLQELSADTQRASPGSGR